MDDYKLALKFIFSSMGLSLILILSHLFCAPKTDSFVSLGEFSPIVYSTITSGTDYFFYEKFVAYFFGFQVIRFLKHCWYLSPTLLPYIHQG